MEIEFISVHQDPSMPEPIPAAKDIPQWYKSLPRFATGEKKPDLNKNGEIPSTIKACMPVLDVIAGGYLLLSAADVYIQKNENGIFYNWASHDMLEFHPQEQAPTYPKLKKNLNNENIPKFRNDWIIKTPKGYSCLFITPAHRELPFTIMPAIVDTDSHKLPINFPFILDGDFEGLIPRGTPIAQVFPFRRDDWTMKVSRIADSIDLFKDWQKGHWEIASQFFDRYKRMSWKAKTYK
jgi:hypothetical protein